MIPVGADFCFAGPAWMRVEDDATVRAGAFLLGEDAAAVEAVRLAEVGDTIRRGLPLAEVVLGGGRRLGIPAPLGGEVLEVNGALLRAACAAFRDPCTTGWIARVRPRAAVADLAAGAVRRVLLVGQGGDAAARVRDRLEHLGCAVRSLADADAARAALRRAPGALLMIDADSMGPTGVDLVRGVGEAAPGTKVVVLASDGAPDQIAYRTARVFYYAVTPLSDGELVDILHSAFREPPRPPARRPPASAREPALRAIRIRNPHGERVALLGAGKLLFADHGLGGAILERLLAAPGTVETAVGSGDLGLHDVAQALGTSERVLVLWAHDSGRIPGSLVRGTLLADHRPHQPARGAWSLVVQPAADGGEPLGFAPCLCAALAEVVVEEMTVPPVGAWQP
jgi:glycine cleavage system H lipoate-binding protein